jgi:hypothetical protein
MEVKTTLMKQAALSIRELHVICGQAALDVKPDNFDISDDMALVFSDSLAFMQSAKTPVTSVKGTLGYMSPEIRKPPC